MTSWSVLVALSLCSIHSFTPVYRGCVRDVEVGVLFDAHDAHAEELAAALSEQGFTTALNEPYSGKDGLIWDSRELSEFLINPKAYMKGTKMTFSGFKKQDEIEAVIAYLSSFPG